MEPRPSHLFTAALVIVGVAAGYGAHAWLIGTAEPQIVEKVITEQIKDEISDEELESICATLTLTDRQRLTTAQDRITDLEGSLEDKELELAALKAERARAKDAGAELVAKLKALEAEVETLRTELQEVTEERDQLMVELKETVHKLEDQIRETEKYKKAARTWKRKSTENAWRSFVAEAKVNICDKGTRKRHEKCHEAVEATLTDAVQERFEDCVDTYQAVPTLSQLDRKETPPAFAQSIDNDKAFTSRDWFILFCDPSLPEAGGVLDVVP